MKQSTRRLLLGAAVGAPLAAWLARPAETGGPHSAYFERLAAALKAAGVAQPRLVIDLPRLQANLDAIAAHRKTGMGLRVVLKSLPCLDLIDQVQQRWQTQRVMAFNAAQTLQLLKARQQQQLLLGKPLPVAAAASLLAQLPADVGSSIEFLVDTEERLAQYAELSRQRGQVLRINLEIDVGLHRGGFEDEASLGPALQRLKTVNTLRFSGLMGYDAHVAALPDLPGMRSQAWAVSQQRYQAAWALVQQQLAAPSRETLTLNTAGSPTFRLHDGRGVANEVSIGSAALLPSDFDKPLLADLQAAAFIATPVLKAWPRFRLPEGASWLGQAAQAWDRNQLRGYAIHGGHWLADPISPPGVQPSGLYGASSNQQVMVSSERVLMAPDDLMFWRPRQSEALLLQFGDLLVYDGQRISDSWPVLPASA